MNLGFAEWGFVISSGLKKVSLVPPLEENVERSGEGGDREGRQTLGHITFQKSFQILAPQATQTFALGPNRHKMLTNFLGPKAEYMQRCGGPPDSERAHWAFSEKLYWFSCDRVAL